MVEEASFFHLFWGPYRWRELRTEACLQVYLPCSKVTGQLLMQDVVGSGIGPLHKSLQRQFCVFWSASSRVNMMNRCYIPAWSYSDYWPNMTILRDYITIDYTGTQRIQYYMCIAMMLYIYSVIVWALYTSTNTCMFHCAMQDSGHGACACDIEFQLHKIMTNNVPLNDVRLKLF